MPETEPPKRNIKQEQPQPKLKVEDKATAELAKRATKSTRYERKNLKEQRENAEKVFESLKKGEIPKLDLKAMSSSDIAAAKAIIADIEHAHELSWLTKEGIPDNPVVLDIIARIASAPQEIQNDPKWLIAQGLELQEAQKGSMPDELKIAIQKVSYRIRNRVIELTGINEEDRHAIFLSSFDPKVLTSVTPEQAEVVEMAEYYLTEAGSPMRGRRPKTLSGNSKWLYDSAKDTVTNTRLQSILNTFNKDYGEEYNAENLDIAYSKLSEAVTNGVATADEVRKFKDRIEGSYRIMKGERFNLTPEIIRQLRDPGTRDEIFYERIRTVLNNPNQPSQVLMDLYTTSYLNTFLYAIGNLPEGDKLVAHFTNLKESVFAFHDLDYYARSAAGDVKSFQQAATYFQNAYAVEAMSDPLVESMVQSYEQALKMIRDNNDGYIPPSLVSYSPKTSENYWDELARQIFEEKVKAGLIHDAAIETRGENKGFRKLDKEGRTFKQGRKLTIDDLRPEKMALRIKATMRMAKGMGVLNMRLLEIFAFSKTPGYTSPEYGTAQLGFSSKAYEGLARWLNPMADWWGKYKMGDTMWAPFFATLIGLDHNVVKEFITWDQHQWEKVIDMAANGELHDWIQKKYGSNAGQMLDLVSEFAFTGRFGPLSAWGEKDATVGFTELDREREGGSMRLFQAARWAEGKIKQEYLTSHAGASESDWIKWKNKKSGQDKIKEYTKAYKTHVWVQTVMRSPTIVAGFARVPGETYRYRNEDRPKLLRSVVIEEILGADYDIEANVKSEVSPSIKQKALAARINLLESDVMLVQQKALNGDGVDHRPRDIRDTDVGLVIRGDKTIKDPDGNKVTIIEAIRRSQAKEYIQKVRTYMLGTNNAAQWEGVLGVHYDASGNLLIDHSDIASGILEHAPGNPLLSEDLLSRSSPQNMGTDDVQWQYLDLEALGERQWFRRANDLMARSEAIMGLTKSLDALRPHPDLKELGKALEDVYNAEKNHFPETAHRFVYLWSKGIGEMYRQTVWGKIPFIGRLVSRLTPSSIAAQIYGAEHGAAWSANNEKEFVGVVQQSTKLPYKEVDRFGARHENNIHKLEKELGATRTVVIIEMIGLGMFLAIAATGLAAITKSLEDKD